MHIQLNPIGSTVATVSSFAAALDIISIWSTNPNRAQIGRLCAAAIGATCEAFQLPPYKLSQADPISYGGRCLDILLRRGVSAPEIYENGTNLLIFISEQLPQQKEIEQVKKNIEPAPEASSGLPSV